MIFHCQKSLLFYKNEPWKRKDSDSCFEVIMSTYDGAELWEFIGIYLLSQLCIIISKNICERYRDDGLMIQKYINGPQIEQLCQKIMKIFQEIGFKIDIETNLKIVNFVDMTFNQINGSYKPYKKPNDKLLYINKNSNHPPQVIKKLPKTINDRLCRNSTNAGIFHSSKIEYEAALKNSAYKIVDFKQKLVIKNNNEQKRQRKSYGLTHHLGKQCQQMLQNDSQTFQINRETFKQKVRSCIEVPACQQASAVQL